MMKLSISNIAWDPPEEEEVVALMDEFGFKGLEVAPTKIWDRPTVVNMKELEAYRNKWEERGKTIVALQALLYGRPDLNIFGNQKVKKETYNYLTKLIRLGGGLGAGSLVFGSPKNRRRGDLPFIRAQELAAEFFRGLGEVAAEHNTILSIEPNPVAYGCDFIQTVSDGVTVVRLIDHPNVRLNLDTGIMTINGESYEQCIDLALDVVSHIHISEPQLGVIGQGDTNHKRIARHLRSIGYIKWVSIEMRNGWTKPNLISVKEALQYVREIYW